MNRSGWIDKCIDRWMNEIEMNVGGGQVDGSTDAPPGGKRTDKLFTFCGAVITMHKILDDLYQ